METRFSQRLTMLMKERKISGQKIGEAVGKSQKTISRYANGEIDPDKEMKNAIYRAIADISGIEEDAMTEAELDEQEYFWEFTKEMSVYTDCAEYEIAREYEEEREKIENNLKSTFRMLSLGAKKFYLDNFELLHMVERWENDVLGFYHNLPSSKQEELIRYLENFNFNYKFLNNHNRLSAYMRMINNSKKRPVIIMDKDNESKDIDSREKELQKEYEDKLGRWSIETSVEEMLYYPHFLSYTPHDWYFLLRVQIFEFYDKETCMWDPEIGTMMGVKLAHLLDAMK